MKFEYDIKNILMFVKNWHEHFDPYDMKPSF